MPEIPPIRNSGKISVILSERRFITPKRESQEVAEREWCAKQHEIMVNRLGFCPEDLKPEERDIDWLLNKGHTFLKKKNFLAAISAFTCGINLSNEAPDLFLGRARAQYCVKNYKRCVSIPNERGISYLFIY